MNSYSNVINTNHIKIETHITASDFDKLTFLSIARNKQIANLVKKAVEEYVKKEMNHE